jgi:hypothetical protein
MGLIGAARDLRRWIGTARILRRRGGAGTGRVDPGGGPGAPPRPTVRRPDDDPALAARLSRWRAPAGDTGPPAAMTARERAAAMRDLNDLRARMAGPQGAAIDAAIAAGHVRVRRLGPQDGHVWELPGLRVFAIAGVQAFTVDDESPP